MSKRINLWRWGVVAQRCGQATPWPWIEIRIFRRKPRPNFGPNLVDCPIDSCNGAAMSQAALNEHLRVRHGDF